MELRLPEELAVLLAEVLEKLNIELDIVDARCFHISGANINRIIDGLSTEFCETGLQPNDEPNQRGLLIEDLIDRINRFRTQSQ